MAKILFISEAYLKKFTPMGSLVEWVDIEPSVHSSQDSYLQDILGTNFYNYLQDVYSAQTLNTNEIALMNYIKPAVAHRATEQAAVTIQMQIKNKGIVVQNGDYSQPIDLDSFKYLRNELRNRAEFYAKRLTNYLCDNRELFPQYTTDNDTDMNPKKGGYNDQGLAFWF